MDNTKQSVLSFCSGYGGIERGLKLAGVPHRVVTHVEIEAFSVAVLVKEMEKGYLDASPIWTDLKTFPAKQFCNKVHGITAGYPCQPFSVAGKGKGNEDARHLFPFIIDHIKTIKPAWVFLENVRGHVRNGLQEVITELGRANYRSSWGIFSASEVGARHQRERVFVLAYSKGKRVQRLRTGREQESHSYAQKVLSVCESKRPCKANWEAEPRVDRVVDGTPDRIDRIRMLGNGVVPQQAAKAFLTLNRQFKDEFQN